ncbi:MAG: MFS transporter [Spirochaetales bacterium]|nr:MFS transporter [Spirochaetales bacterium]
MRRDVVRSRADRRLGRPYWTLWTATVVSQAGDWAQIVAQGVLVLHIGGSAAQVGLVSGMRILPQLAVTLVGGIVADRGNKKKLLSGIAVSQLLISIIPAIVVWRDDATVPMLLVASGVLGLLAAVWRPVYLSYIVDLVGRDEKKIQRGLSYSSTGLHLCRTVGPALAGVLIGLRGVELVYAFNVLTFLCPALLMLTLPASPARAGRTDRPRTVTTQLMDIVRNPTLVWSGVTALSLSLAVVPVFSHVPTLVRVRFGPANMALSGYLLTAVGAAQVVGSLAASAFFAADARKIAALTALYFVQAAALIVVGNVPGSIATVAALAALSCIYGLSSPAMSSMVAGSSGDAVGLSQSVYLMTYGVVPLGQLLWGVGIDRLGLAQSTTLWAVLLTVLSISGWVVFTLSSRKSQSA